MPKFFSRASSSRTVIQAQSAVANAASNRTSLTASNGAATVAQPRSEIVRAIQQKLSSPIKAPISNSASSSSNANPATKAQRPAMAPANLSQVALNDFPRNGLRYAGKNDSAKETLYKKDLRRVPKGTTVQNFRSSLTLKLTGIERILLELDSATPPENPFIPKDSMPAEDPSGENKKAKLASNAALQGQKYESFTTNAEFIQSIVPQPNNRHTPLKFSKKIIALMQAVEKVESPKEMTGVFNFANKNDPRISRLLDGFFQKNLAHVDPLNLEQNATPFIFFKYALRAELYLIAKQLTVLEGVVKKSGTSKKQEPDQRNVGFLDYPDDNVNKQKMLWVISKKLAETNATYDQILEHPANAAVEQFTKLSGAGSMNIALKNPATRPFSSRLNPLMKISKTISEEQFDALLSIEDAIMKGNGQAKIRIRTGGGKSTIMELTPQFFTSIPANNSSSTNHSNLSQQSPMRPAATRSVIRSPVPASRQPASHKKASIGLSAEDKVINLDLNSSKKFIDELLQTNLVGKIVQADEAFFYGSLFLDGRIAGNSNNSNQRAPTAAEITKLQNDFLFSLRKKGAVVSIVGASESVTKIQHECNRIAEKIRLEEIELSKSQNRDLIAQANSFLYSIHGGQRKSRPVFLDILPPSTQLTQLWNNQAAAQSAIAGGKPIPLVRDKKDRQPIPISNKEFLIRTAYYLKELCRFANIAQFEAVLVLDEALVPTTIGNSKKRKRWESSEGLEALLQIARVLPNKKFKEYTLNTNRLHEAVTAFFDAALHESLPSDKKQQLPPTRLNELIRKLRSRESQLADLKARRDESTLERLQNSKLFLTNPEDATAQNATPSLSSAVHGILSSSSRVQGGEMGKDGKVTRAGEKVQYILPDFEINEQTCSKNDLREILNLSGADFLVIPHKKEGKELQCQIVRSSSEKGAEGVLIETINTAKIDDTILPAKSVISFFDRTNSIGGDYGNVSVNISRQYIHLTQNDCLRGYRALDRNYLMQYNRDRTDPDEVSDDMDLKLILPRAALIAQSIDIPSDNKMSTGLVALINANTIASDQFHLDGYLASKEERKPKAAQENQDAPGVLEAAHATTSQGVSNRGDLQKKEQLKPARSLLQLLNEADEDSEDEAEEDSEVEDNDDVLPADVVTQMNQAVAETNMKFPGSQSAAEADEEMSDFEDDDNSSTADESDDEELADNAAEQMSSGGSSADVEEDQVIARLRSSQLFLTPLGNEAQTTAQSLFKVVSGVLSDGSSGFKSGERMQYILPDFEINERTCTDEDLEQILDLTKAVIVTVPIRKSGDSLRYKIAFHLEDGEGTDCWEVSAGELSEILRDSKNDTDKIIISFFDKKNANDTSCQDDDARITKQYVHLTQDDCLTYLNRSSLSRYDHRSDVVSQELGAMDLKLILPRAVLAGRIATIPSNHVMSEELVELIARNQEVEYPIDAANNSQVAKAAMEINSDSAVAALTGSQIKSINVADQSEAEHKLEAATQDRDDGSQVVAEEEVVIEINLTGHDDNAVAALIGLLQAGASSNSINQAGHELEDDGSQVAEEEMAELSMIGGESAAAPDLTPSTSTTISRAAQLLTLCKSTPQEDSFWNRTGVNNLFITLNAAYQTKEDVNSTISRIIIYTALSCQEPLSIEEVERSLNISRVHGSLSHAFDHKRDKLTEEDLEKEAKYRAFSGRFQRECKRCGIFSNKLPSDFNTTQSNYNELDGIRLSNVPKEAGAIISKVRQQIESKGVAFENFLLKSAERVEQKRRLVVEVWMAEEERLQSLPSKSSTGR